MRLLLIAATAFALLAVPTGLAAQEGRGYSRGYAIPNGHLPPPGECRVWRPGVPAGQQRPPTDCATARYEARRYGGRVIYGGGEGGDEYRRDRYDRDGRYDREHADRYGPDRREDDGRYRCDEKDYRKGEC